MKPILFSILMIAVVGFILHNRFLQMLKAKHLKKPIMITWLLAAVGMLGCATNPHVRIDKINSATATMEFTRGPFTTIVDEDGEMEKYCFPSAPEILETKESQFPGQYRFQKTIRFACIENSGSDTRHSRPLAPNPAASGTSAEGRE